MKLIIKKLKKYWHIFPIYWQVSLQYRTELIMWTLIDALPLVTMVFIWFGVYRYGSQLGEYTLITLISYYIGSNLISRLTTAHFELEAVHQVNDGSIVKYFVKPFSFVEDNVLGQTSWKIMSFFLITLPIIAILILTVNSWIIIPSLAQIAVIMVFLILAYVLDSILSFFIVAGAFYMEQASSLSHAKWIVTGIFAGTMLPLDVYPIWLERIARFLPFKYLAAVPLEIYLGKTNLKQVPILIGMEIIWIIALIIALSLLWKKAEKKFTAVGQ